MVFSSQLDLHGGERGVLIEERVGNTRTYRGRVELYIILCLWRWTGGLYNNDGQRIPSIITLTLLISAHDFTFYKLGVAHSPCSAWCVQGTRVRGLIYQCDVQIPRLILAT